MYYVCALSGDDSVPLLRQHRINIYITKTIHVLRAWIHRMCVLGNGEAQQEKKDGEEHP